MSPTVEVESALGLSKQIEEAAEQKGWERKWADLGSITNSLDRVFFDTFLFKNKKNGRKVVAGVVFIDGKSDLVFASSEEFLEEIGMSGLGEE